MLNTLLGLSDVTSVDNSTVRKATALRAKDFEDALQYYSAKSMEADCIVTSNVKDFTFSDIPVYKPEEFLDKIANSRMNTE